MEIILARHGNTFAPGDKIVWVGQSEDFPLVEKGLIQAKELASLFLRCDIKPQAIYCSSLQRTKTAADIIAKKLSLAHKPCVDSRIDEIDYGKWSGLSSEEIIARFGKEELEAWNERSIWPVGGVWNSVEDVFVSNVLNFAKELLAKHESDEQVLIVSSNGVMRYFLKLIPDEFEQRLRDRSFKVKTGHVCKIICEDKKLKIAYWNANPSDISQV